MKKKKEEFKYYSCWDGDGGFTFCEGTQKTEFMKIDEKQNPSIRYKCLKTFKAKSWNEAQTMYHKWQGWEPYKPMEGTEDAG